MIELAVATAAWLLTHLGISNTPLRGALAARLGELGYTVLYSIIALATLTWMIMAWNDAPRQVWLWEPTGWTRIVPIAVMPLATILLVGGLVAPNPTAAGQAGRLGDPDAVRGVLRITRHPVQWAFLLWAVAHAFPNGDLTTLILLFGIGAVAALGPLLIDRRKAAADPEGFARFAASTSWLPFAAILGGRNRLAWRELVVPVIGGILVAGAMVSLHPWFAGVPVVAR